MRIPNALLLSIWLPLLATAQWRPETVLYGAAYYHEYMPQERLAKDIELMKQAGYTVVRVGESTWSSWEPREGDFQFAWMDRIVDAFHKAGIHVIMGTPTYSIPPWMFKKHPEMIVTRFTSTPPLGDPWHPSYPGFTAPGAYGPRQNMDLTHPEYRRYSERVIRKIAERYAKHPGIIGWQVDNETAPNGLALPHVHQAFVQYLKEKYGSPQKLNELWGLVYWGQLVDNWDELPPRDGILNPGYKLEWERFQQRIVTDFLAWQAKIVREYARPDQFITHDFVGGLLTNVDQWGVSRHMDVASTNIYHATQEKLDGNAIAFGGDLARSLKMKHYFVMETNAQAIGWDSRAQFPPYDGQLRLAAWAHVASGASLISYWHWHSLHYGQETYWRGILGHDLEPNRVYRESSRFGNELKRIGPRLAGLQKNNAVAILHSNESHHAIRYMPFSDRTDYMSILRQFYNALFRMNIEADFVNTDTQDLSRYKVLLVPPLYAASDAVLARVAKFVEDGGHAIVALKSGFANEHSTVRAERAPGPLRKAAGFSYQEFSNLVQPLGLKPDVFSLGDKNRASTWVEFIVPESAEAVATYDHPFFGKYPAVTRNRYGKGTLTYQGTVVSDELQQALVRRALNEAKLVTAEQDAAVRIRHGVTAQGPVHFYLNFSGEARECVYLHNAGSDVLTGTPIRRNQTIKLGPWDVAVVAESFHP
jgi:beta-galactosidase